MIVDPEAEDSTADLISLTRRVMYAAGTTSVDAAQALRARALLEQAADLLEQERSPQVARKPFTEQVAARVRAGEPWTMFRFNPQGIPFTMTLDGECDRVSSELFLGALYEGPPGLLHGGFAAQVLDALLGTLVHARGLPVFTAALEIRYLRPTPLGRAARLIGEITEITGRKALATGWIEVDGVRTVVGVGTFVCATKSSPADAPPEPTE